MHLMSTSAAVNDMIAALTFDPAMVDRLLADTVAALRTNQSVIIRLPHRGIGMLNGLAQALRDETIRHAIYAADALDPTDLTGIAYLDENKNVAYAQPFFVRELADDDQKVIVLDEVQAAFPKVGEFIRSQSQRGRMVLIFSNDYDFHLYDDFPAVRLTA
jgi:hypothetical protein